jgi:hypothetical protein
MDAETWDTVTACLIAIVFPSVIPWDYVFCKLRDETRGSVKMSGNSIR